MNALPFSLSLSPSCRQLRRLSACLLLVLPGLAAAQSDSNPSPLSAQELERINKQPLAPRATTELNRPREPSFVLNDTDGTQVREYRNKGRATDIEVHSGMGTSYQMSKPEEGVPQQRDRTVNRVPSVPILKF
ncbi:MAG TPA: hypothetical protein VM512_15615 [Burkholderiaceae bacterium]|jgi:hypothetical protein|nr:hypothetical protein [Burkholderiaceae bacterium]